MRKTIATGGAAVERKIISVSAKRQLTIPQKYFNALGFDNEAECILREDGILVRPLREAGSGEFAEQILSDLIEQGFEGQVLLDKFKVLSLAVRPAVRKLIEEADAFAKGGEGSIPIEKLFGTEE